MTVFLFGATAHALIDPPTLRFSIGHSAIKFTAIDKNEEPQLGPDQALGSLMTVNPAFLWDVPTARTRLGIHFMGDFFSQFGLISLSGVGANFVFYPLGLSTSREVKNDGDIIHKSRMSPFIDLKVTYMKFAVRDPSEPDPAFQTYFNIALMDISGGVGVDYPINDNLTCFGGVHYRFGSFTGSEAKIGRLEYGGMAFMLGLMTNFY